MQGGPGKPRPKSWTFPDDPVKTKAYLCYLRAKAQAKFREEFWDLTFDQWWHLWTSSGQWHNKGKAADEYCMLQRNTDLGWTVDNAYIATREEHFKTQRQRRKQHTAQPEWDSRDLRFRVPRGSTGNYKHYDYDAVLASIKRRWACQEK